jgi:hypothetical protein
MKYKIIILLLLISILSFGQSKKEAKKNKIKSTTVSQTIYDNGNPVTYKDSYEEFDKNGNTLIKIEYKKDGTVKHKETARYDIYNNKIEETEYDADDQTNKRKTYKYNAFNDKIEETEYNAAGAITKSSAYTYNTDGDRATEVITDESGKVKKKNVYTFNSNHLKVEKQSFNISNKLESLKKWSYEYF